MDRMRCSCGGTFQSLGPEFIRTGEVSGYSLLTGHAGNDWAEGAIPGELFACDQCRAIKFCADGEWIARRLEENRKKEEQRKDAEQWAEKKREERIQDYMKSYAHTDEKKLQKIVENQSWMGYGEEEREAARRLLEQRRSQPQAQSQRWKDWN